MMMDIELLRCETWGALWQLSANQCRGLLSFCISDTAKRMLLKHAGFIPHLVRRALNTHTHTTHTYDTRNT
jgi:hypothetical protein